MLFNIWHNVCIIEHENYFEQVATFSIPITSNKYTKQFNQENYEKEHKNNRRISDDNGITRS